jgi:TolB protein
MTLLNFNCARLLKSLCLLVFACALGFNFSANAQLAIEIGGAGAQQIPVAILPFAGDALADEVTSIVRSDLQRTGLFKLIDTPATAGKITESASPASAELRRLGVDAASWGGVYRTADGRLDIRLRLQDTLRNTLLDSSSFTVKADARGAGHAIANRLYEKLTGQKGFFLSKLSYVTQLGREQYELRVADWDGQNPQVALRSREPIISPTFSPDAGKLAYVSFESRKATIFVHELATGTRNVIASFKGTNSAPAFAPNGRSLAAALSRDGLAQIYELSIDGAPPRRLTQSAGIDTEPAYSADGASIYFVSDRGGQPQIYRMASSGGEAQRVTFKGDYNISPAPSPDGKLLAYITRREGKFMAAVLDLVSQQETLVSDSAFDESPIFTSNSQFVMYATKQRGRGVLVLASSDGRIRTTLSLATADIREPALSR